MPAFPIRKLFQRVHQEFSIIECFTRQSRVERRKTCYLGPALDREQQLEFNLWPKHQKHSGRFQYETSTNPSTTDESEGLSLGKSPQTHQPYTLSRTGIDLLRPVEQLFRVRRHQRVTLSRQLHDDPPLS
jgi:hypothetical protein